MTRLLSGLVIVIVVCLGAIPLLVPQPAQAQDNGPEISVSPRSGAPGTEVTVRGSNFTPNQWVDIYYYLDGTDRVRVAEVQITATATSFTANFIVPESHKGNHQVLAQGTDDSVARFFEVRPSLTVSPTQGPVGGTVTVTGRGFGRNEGDIEIRFGGQVIADGISASLVGRWEEPVVVPSATGGTHTIRAEGDDRTVATVSFDVKPGIMLDRSGGWPGQTVNMTGNAFAFNERHISILFDGEELVTEIRADDDGFWQETFEVPELPAGTYTVTADGDRTKSADLDGISFQIRPGLLLSPDEGHVGMNLTVIGRGFEPNAEVDVLYDEDEVAAATTDDNGSFEVTFEVPESPSGDREVTAEDAAGNTASADFEMESDPPDTPELISPRDEGRAGFVGRVRPTFEWSEVFDLSGVYYRLQVSASANVTETGEFVDPIVSTVLLDEAGYRLQKDEGLRYGTYYWIVQAVDGAENEGEWTEPHSFRAGLLPLWAFIVIIAVVALLGGGLVYYFVVRRRMYL